MKLEKCDRCGQTERQDSEAVEYWTDIECIGRSRVRVSNIRKATYCPTCADALKTLLEGFRSN